MLFITPVKSLPECLDSAQQMGTWGKCHEGSEMGTEAVQVQAESRPRPGANRLTAGGQGAAALLLLGLSISAPQRTWTRGFTPQSQGAGRTKCSVHLGELF